MVVKTENENVTTTVSVKVSTQPPVIDTTDEEVSKGTVIALKKFLTSLDISDVDTVCAWRGFGYKRPSRLKVIVIL